MPTSSVPANAALSILILIADPLHRKSATVMPKTLRGLGVKYHRI